MNGAEIAVPITAAFVTASGAVAAALVQLRRLRRENSEQHDRNMQRLDANHELLSTIHDDVREVRADVKQVRSDLDKHLGEHEAMQPFRRVR
jgi:hypothetical protein